MYRRTMAYARAEPETDIIMEVITPPPPLN